MNEKLVIDSDRDRELQATRFSQMQNNFCNESKPDTDTDTASEETIMPPPAPYYVRRPHLLGSQTISRTKSATTSRETHAKNLLASQRSLPNLNFARSQHNRRIGSTPEFRADAQQKSRLSLRAAEFDALLEHL